MFERPHHQRIAKVLSALNVDLLQDCDCYLGGSVPIVLPLGEYREVADINFLCTSVDGFRRLRNTLTEQALAVNDHAVPPALAPSWTCSGSSSIVIAAEDDRSAWWQLRRDP